MVGFFNWNGLPFISKTKTLWLSYHKNSPMAEHTEMQRNPAYSTLWTTPARKIPSLLRILQTLLLYLRILLCHCLFFKPSCHFLLPSCLMHLSWPQIFLTSPLTDAVSGFQSRRAPPQSSLPMYASCPLTLCLVKDWFWFRWEFEFLACSFVLQVNFGKWVCSY